MNETILKIPLGDENWELKQPLNIAVEQRSPEDFTACLYDADLYGYGESIPEALEDLKLVIVNQYEYLLQQKDRVELGNPLKKQFEFLNHIIMYSGYSFCCKEKP